MKLQLYIVDYFRDIKDNGLNTYIDQLGKGLEDNNQIDLTYVWIDSKGVSLKIEELQCARNLYVPKFSARWAKERNSDDYISNLLANDMKSKENIVVHLNWINDCSIAWHLKQKVNCKIILTKHCIPWRDFVNNNFKDFYKLNVALEKGRAIPLTWPQLQQEQVNYEHLDHIITVTDCAKGNLANIFDVLPERITTINNGIQILNSKKKKLKDQLRKKYGFSDQDKIILFAGTIKASKGVFDLVRVFEKLVYKNPENLRLVIAGAGDLAMLVKKVKKYWSKISITGSLDKTTLYDFYQISDIGVVPSYVEQCSYTAIEMMQMGLPIVVSDVDGLKEIVPEDCGLRVKVNYSKSKGARIDDYELLSNIEFLLQNKVASKKMASNAKKHAFRTFNLKQMIDRTLDVYQKVTQTEAGTIEKSRDLIPILTAVDIPLVSIVINPASKPEYLNLCIDSILSQSYSNFELFIIETTAINASTNYVKPFTDARMKYVANEGRLNSTLGIAKGKYIIHFNSENLMHPDSIALQIDFLERNPSYGMIGSWHETIDSFGKVISRMQTPTKHEDITLALLFGNPFSHALVATRSHLLKKFKYVSSADQYQDYHLWIKISAVSKVANLPYNLLSYRSYEKDKHAQSLNGENKNMIPILSKNLERIKISYSKDEFIVHMAICFGYKDFFNSEDKTKSLRNWLEKLFSSEILVTNYSRARLTSFKQQLLNNF